MIRLKIPRHSKFTFETETKSIRDLPETCCHVRSARRDLG